MCILNYTKAIYNIGTEILYFQCFVTMDMFLFSKSIIPEDSKSARRVLKHAGVKTRFKAILKKVDFGVWIRLQVFVHGFLPPEGD